MGYDYNVWLVHTWHMNMGHDAFTYTIWDMMIHVNDVCHTHMGHDSFTYGTWIWDIFHTCELSRADSSSDMTHSHVTCLSLTHTRRVSLSHTHTAHVSLTHKARVTRGSVGVLVCVAVCWSCETCLRVTHIYESCDTYIFLPSHIFFLLVWHIYMNSCETCLRVTHIYESCDTYIFLISLTHIYKSVWNIYMNQCDTCFFLISNTHIYESVWNMLTCDAYIWISVTHVIFLLVWHIYTNQCETYTRI